MVQNLRRDFMTGILSEEELGGKHLYVHELRRGCACNVPTHLRFLCHSPILICTQLPRNLKVGLVDRPRLVWTLLHQ